MTAERAVGLRGDGRGWILFAVAIGWLFVIGSRFLIPTVLPQVKLDFGLDNTGGGVAITIIWATYALFQMPAGLLTDRLGERRLLAGSLVVSAVSVVALGLAPVFAAFLVACAGFGFATGLYGPPRGTLLSRTFTGNDGTAIGITLATGSIGSALLPFLAGVLVGDLGWRIVITALFGPLAVVGGMAWWAIPGRSPGGSTTAVPIRGLVRDVGRAVKIRGVLAAVMALTLLVFVFQGLTAFYVTYLVDVKEFSQSTAAAMLALVFLSGAVSQVAGGFVADRIGPRRVLVVTTAVGVATVAAIPFVGSWLSAGVLSVILGTRMAITPVSNAYVVDALPSSVTGTAWGTLRTAFFLIGATGSTVVGIMADADLFGESFFVLAGLTFLAGGFYCLLPGRAAVDG